jgi:polar amino acid transport system substrate-binding protein
MAFGDTIPPFSFPETGTGIELEVIGEALALRHHKLVPRYYPLARVPLVFKQRLVEAAMTDLGQEIEGAFYGDPAVVYNNVFITLASRKLSIKTPADLDGLTLLSFQGAVKRYPDWLTRVKEEGRYFEQADQLRQVRTLQRGHFDVVLSDISIYRYFSLQLQQQNGLELQPVQFHPFAVLNPLDYRPVFWDERIRDDFNAGLAFLKASGRYQAIYDKYLTQNNK